MITFIICVPNFFSDGAVHKYFNPYDTPYEAFINYMNVLSDFLLRVEKSKNSDNLKSITNIVAQNSTSNTTKKRPEMIKTKSTKQSKKAKKYN